MRHLHLELGGDEGEGEADDEERGEADGDRDLARGTRGEGHCIAKARNSVSIGAAPQRLAAIKLLTRLHSTMHRRGTKAKHRRAEICEVSNSS